MQIWRACISTNQSQYRRRESESQLKWNSKDIFKARGKSFVFLATRLGDHWTKDLPRSGERFREFFFILDWVGDYFQLVRLLTVKNGIFWHSQRQYFYYLLVFQCSNASNTKQFTKFKQHKPRNKIAIVKRTLRCTTRPTWFYHWTILCQIYAEVHNKHRKMI